MFGDCKQNFTYKCMANIFMRNTINNENVWLKNLISHQRVESIKNIRKQIGAFCALQ